MHTVWFYDSTRSFHSITLEISMARLVWDLMHEAGWDMASKRP